MNKQNKTKINDNKNKSNCNTITNKNKQANKRQKQTNRERKKRSKERDRERERQTDIKDEEDYERSLTQWACHSWKNLFTHRKFCYQKCLPYLSPLTTPPPPPTSPHPSWSPSLYDYAVFFTTSYNQVKYIDPPNCTMPIDSLMDCKDWKLFQKAKS